MKFCSNNTQVIKTVILSVFFTTGSILFAQQPVANTEFLNPPGSIENYLHNLSVFPWQETAIHYRKKLQEVTVNAETSIKRDSIYTYNIHSGDSVLSRKTIYFYNNSEQVVRTLSYQWDITEQSWTYGNKQEYTYDNYGYTTSNSEYQWRDNEFWQITSSKEFSYDSAGNLLMDANYFYDFSMEELRGVIKCIFTYYPNGLKKSFSWYDWDTNNKTWKTYYRFDYTYNDKTLLETMIFSNGDESGSDWDRDRKDSYEYNDMGQRILQYTYYYNTSIGEWDLSQRYNYVYDTINNLTETICYVLNSEWELSGKVLRTYQTTTDGNHYVRIDYEWNSNEEDWVLSGNSIKEIIDTVFFDSGGYRRSRYVYYRNTIDSLWGFCCGSSNSYDSCGHRTSLILYRGNRTDTLVNPFYHNTASYNPDGLLIFHAFYTDWNSDQSVWETGSKTEFAYNESQQLIYSLSWKMPKNPGWIRKSSDTYYYSDFVLPDTGIYFSNGTLYATLENADSYQWFDCQSGEDIEGADKNRYTSSASGSFGVRITVGNYIVTSPCYNLALSVNNPRNEIIKCYPNPSNGLLHLDFYNTGMPELICTLTSLVGMQVRTFPIPANSSHVTLDLSGLTTGIYFLRVKAGNNILQIQKISIF